MTVCQEVTEAYPDKVRAKPEKIKADLERMEAAVGSSEKVWAKLKPWIWGEIQKQ
jgi:hypothetical protein